MNQEKMWQAYNDLMLYGSLDRFTKILARYELFKLAVEVPGDIVECGVFKGTGLLYWAKLLEIFVPNSDRRVIGFDTFSGFIGTTSNETKRTDDLLAQSNYEAPTTEQIMKIANKCSLAHRIELIEGDACETIPKYVECNRGFRVAMLNLDFDIYAPTQVALRSLFPLVVPNGVVIFDEYAKHGFGESDAVDEYFAHSNIQYETISWALSPTAYLVKE